MKFSLINSLALAAPLLSLLATSVYASPIEDGDDFLGLKKRSDYREVYTFTQSSATAACNTWRCKCVNYDPSTSGLTFQYAYCEAGNESGKKTTTEVTAYCTFSTSSGGTQSINKHIASEGSFTLV